MTAKQDILAEIEQYAAGYVRFLQSLVQAPSPNPPGDTVAAITLVQDYLSKNGITSSIIAPQPSCPNIVSDFTGGKGAGPRVILNGHIDTFPTGDAGDWDEDPFSGRSDGTSIFGRGTVDMKAGTAASIIAFSLLQKRADQMKGSVALTVVSDEETGGRWGTRHLLEECGDPSPWKGDVVPNGEPGGLQSVRFGEKGTLRLTFTVRTKGANGAYRHLSRGANIVAAQLIQELLKIEDMKPDIPEDVKKLFRNPDVRGVANEIMGDGAADIILVPTLNIGTIHGGSKVNVIPEKCIFEADIRLPIGLTADTVMRRVDSILEGFPMASVARQEAASNPANHCTFDHALAQHIAKNAADVTGRKPIPLIGIGGTDCKFWRYLGIPAFVYGPSPKGMGAKTESVLIEEFLALVKVHTLAVWDLLSEDAGTLE